MSIRFSEDVYLSRVNQGRITIPKRFRRLLNINDGDFVALRLVGNHIILKRVSVEY